MSEIAFTAARKVKLHILEAVWQSSCPQGAGIAARTWALLYCRTNCLERDCYSRRYFRRAILNALLRQIAALIIWRSESN